MSTIFGHGAVARRRRREGLAAPGYGGRRGEDWALHLRRVVRVQESNRRLQHLQAGLSARQPVILVIEHDEVNGRLEAAQRLEHDLTLLKRDDGVIATVDQ